MGHWLAGLAAAVLFNFRTIKQAADSDRWAARRENTTTPAP